MMSHHRGRDQTDRYHHLAAELNAHYMPDRAHPAVVPRLSTGFSDVNTRLVPFGATESVLSRLIPVGKFVRAK